MDEDMFAMHSYGKIALEKIKPDSPNFRLYYAGWLGKNGESDVMEVRGAVFRAAKSGQNKGKLCMLVPGTQKTAWVSVAEMDAYEKREE